MKQSKEQTTGSEKPGKVWRRKSDSNILPVIQAKRRASHVSQESFSKSPSSLLAQRQLQQRLIGKRTDKSSQQQEDTFCKTLEIRLQHSVGSMSISPTSRDVVLAGRQGLVIIDLENPWLIPRIMPHMSKWEVADVQWSPYVSRESCVASTANQRLLVWNLHYSGSQAIELVLHAHSRAISDINWSPHHPDLLATCSVDTYVHLWDLRCAGQSQEADDSRQVRSVHSFTPWNAGTTQVKFNRKSEYILASSHDKSVNIWDIRKGSVPVTIIEAHSKKIYGIDWSRQNDHDIVTCSLDKLVKFWDIHSPEKEKEVIVTNTPVWRARNLPFGDGILMMPQRTESTLFMYSRDQPDQPVHAFEGHTDTVKEFVWRSKGGVNADKDEREFQLVSWSKDQNLRLWPISEDMMKSVGHKSSTNKGLYKLQSISARRESSYESHSFQREPSADRPTSDSSQPASNKMSALRLSMSRTGASMTPFRTPARKGSSGSVGFSTGFEPANVFREQRYTMSPLLWMQNVKTVGPPGELGRNETPENAYQSVVEEMSVVLNKFAGAGVKTEKINPTKRTCTISLHGPWSDTGVAFLRVTIRFSPQYPNGSPPEFEIHKNSMISILYRARLGQDLIALAASYTSQKRWCFEPCVRFLLGEKSHDDAPDYPGTGSAGSDAVGYSAGAPTVMTDSPRQSSFVSSWSSTAVDGGESDDEFFVGPTFAGGFGLHGKRSSLQSEKGIMLDMSAKQSTDKKVPFPRLCGGFFSGNGQLVCFFSTIRFRESDPLYDTASEANRHPRTYDQFAEYREIAAMSRHSKDAPVFVRRSDNAFGEFAFDDDPDDMDEGITNFSSFDFKSDQNSTLNPSNNLVYHGNKTDRLTHSITIFDLTRMMPYSLEASCEFGLIPDDPVAACVQNALICEAYERYDLAKVWRVVQEILTKCVPMGTSDCYGHRKKRRVRWGAHPLGQKMAENMLQHFLRAGDPQTAALIVCALRAANRNERSGSSERGLSAIPPDMWDDGAIDYFSPAATHKPRRSATMNTDEVASPGPSLSNQIAQSYTSRGSHILSYFWDSDRNGVPGMNKGARPTKLPGDRNRRLGLGSLSLTAGKIPNAAPLPPASSSAGSQDPFSPLALGIDMRSAVFDRHGQPLVSDEMSIEFTNMECFDDERSIVHFDTPLLSSNLSSQHDLACLAYADMLYRWKLLDQRAELLKNLTYPPFEKKEETMEVLLRCYECHSEVGRRDRTCPSCRRVRNQIRCSICHVLVRGITNFCLHCGHGGHSSHVKAWFATEDTCPAGCGCQCIFEMTDRQGD